MIKGTAHRSPQRPLVSISPECLRSPCKFSPAQTTRAKRIVHKQRSADAFPPWFDSSRASPEPAVLPLTDLWSIRARLNLEKKQGRAVVKSKVADVFWQHDRQKKRLKLVENLTSSLPFASKADVRGHIQISSRNWPSDRRLLPPILQLDEDERLTASPEVRPRVKFASSVRFSK